MVPFLEKLREAAVPRSLVWLHDGIWISPAPSVAILEASLAAAYRAAGLPECLHDALATRPLAEDRASLLQRIAAPIDDPMAQRAALLRGTKRRAEEVPCVTSKRLLGFSQGEAVRSLFTYFQRTDRRNHVRPA